MDPFVDLLCPSCGTTFSDINRLEDLRTEVGAKEAGMGRLDPAVREEKYQLDQKERRRSACTHDHPELLQQANAALEDLHPQFEALGVEIEHDGVARVHVDARTGEVSLVGIEIPEPAPEPAPEPEDEPIIPAEATVSADVTPTEDGAPTPDSEGDPDPKPAAKEDAAPAPKAQPRQRA